MFGGITALHIERILCQCISMAALKVGNENENEIATCESQCEMLHKYTCMYKFIYVCVCGCECKEIYWKRLPKASERKYGWAWLKLELQEMRSSLLHFIYGFAWRPRKPKTELELNWENLQAACFVCLTKLPASMQKAKREDVTQQRGVIWTIGKL